MTPFFKSFIYAAAILIAGFAAGTALFAPHSKTHLHSHPQAQSWDQENLKRNDHGCPTAVFVAPGGELQQCEFTTSTTVDLTGAKDADGVLYFKSADAAALYIVTKIYALNHYYEYGGVITKAGKEKFYVSIPRSQRHGTDVEFDEDPESYDDPIVASYHVHPCLKEAISSLFSPQDLAGMRTTRTGGYVLDECTGLVHYWETGYSYSTLDELLKLGVNPIALQHGIQMASGKIIGGIVVDGTVIR